MAKAGSGERNVARRVAKGFVARRGYSSNVSSEALARTVAMILKEDFPTNARAYLLACYRSGRLHKKSGDPVVTPREAALKRWASRKRPVYLARGFYDSREWLTLRYRVLLKYGRKCMLCFTVDGEMHVDHVVPRSKAPELELEESNLQVLCKACNLGKSNLDQTDFRPVGRP